MLKVHWHKCGRAAGNFGDNLTALILDYLGVDFAWAPPEFADFFGIGSIAEKIPSGFRGTVWSTGCLFAHSEINLENANVLALRGSKTVDCARLQGQAEVKLGDGGLLASLFSEPPVKHYLFGIVPHYTDQSRSVLTQFCQENKEVKLIDVCEEPLSVIRSIAGCEKIVSSSLHGLVVSDSLGIPDRWVSFDGSPQILGSQFKFLDYYSAFRIEGIEPHQFTEIDDRQLVEDLEGYSRPALDVLQEGLLKSLREAVGDRVLDWQFVTLPVPERVKIVNHSIPQEYRSSGRISIPEGSDLTERQLLRRLQAGFQLLQKIHSLGIAHRRINASTLVWDGNDARLSDFGWALKWSPHLYENEEPGSWQSKLIEGDVRQLVKVFRRYPVKSRNFRAVLQFILEESSGIDGPGQERINTLLQLLLDKHQARQARSVSMEYQDVLTHLLTRMSNLYHRLEESYKEIDSLRRESAEQDEALIRSEIMLRIPPRSPFLLVDEERFRTTLSPEWKPLPFLSNDGQYAGPPKDTGTAIEELEKERSRSNAKWLVFVDSTFWWLEYFRDFSDHIHDRFQKTYQSKNLIIFRL